MTRLASLSLTALLSAAGCATGTASLSGAASGAGSGGQAATSTSAATTGGSGGAGGVSASAASSASSASSATTGGGGRPAGTGGAESSAESSASSAASSASSTSGGGPCGAGQPQAGLAAWYRFEETSGPVCDSSGNGNHGTAQGAGYTRGIAGKIGLAISFDGTDGDVMVPASPTLDMSSAGTIELWVRLHVGSSSSVGSTVSRGTGNNDDNVLMNSSCGNMQTIFTYAQQTTSVTSSCNVIPEQVWTHIAVVNDGTTLTMYTNAVLTTTAAGGDMGPLSSALYLGRREQGVFALAGDLDEVKWWTVVRTPQQICTDAGGTPAGGGCNLP